MANINNVTTAYTNALKHATGKEGMGAPTSNDGVTFGDLVKQSLSSAADAQHTSEKVSGAAIAGQADMTQVLQAVTDAEMTLNTVLAVRDRVIQAYQEIMRTPV